MNGRSCFLSGEVMEITMESFSVQFGMWLKFLKTFKLIDPF